MHLLGRKSPENEILKEVIERFSQKTDMAAERFAERLFLISVIVKTLEILRSNLA